LRSGMADAPNEQWGTALQLDMSFLLHIVKGL
jgi:hypothetical protein